MPKTLKDIVINFIRSRLPDFKDKTFKRLGVEEEGLPSILVQDIKRVPIAAAIERMFGSKTRLPIYDV
jgi:DNA-directed RNA polymerase subunit H (RpoH/RPB5)